MADPHGVAGGRLSAGVWKFFLLNFLRIATNDSYTTTQVRVLAKKLLNWLKSVHLLETLRHWRHQLWDTVARPPPRRPAASACTPIWQLLIFQFILFM